VRVDIHSHFVPRDLPPLAERTGDRRWPVLDGAGAERAIVADGAIYRVVDPTYWSVPDRIDRIDRTGIDVQVISPLPVLLPHWASGADAALWCRAVNAAIAEAVASSAGRFVGFAILPLQEPELAADVWADAKRLGLVGVELGTAVDSERMLHEPFIDELLAHLAHEQVPTLVHPTRPDALGPVSASVSRGLALPTDTAMAVAPRVERDRVSADHPRSCLAHGGGTLIWEWSRIYASRAGMDATFPEWLYVDTAGCRIEHVRFLVEVLGEQAVMFGTDQPAADDLAAAELIESYDAGWADAVDHANAEQFLGIALGR